MQILTIIIAALVLVETTLLLAKNSNKVFGSGKRKVFVDTSSLIDGRILSVAQTGFIGDELVIPKSVLSELQLLADGSDSEKRTRARFGLDVTADLQKVSGLTVTILADGPLALREGVDNRLIVLAKKYGGLIMTNDFNLNKVAVVEGINVLNINDLSQNLRSEFLPGDTLNLDLVQKGSASDQAVGYLSDGTMVVVEDSVGQIGKTVEVEFVRYLQTSAGKMMFAKRVGGKKSDEQPPKRVDRQHTPTKNRDQRGTNEPKSKRQPRQANDKQTAGKKPDDKRRPRRRETGEDRLVRLANK